MNATPALHESINKARQDLGYEQLTEVQEKVLPHGLEKKDLLVRAATGSGKTAAYIIPSLQNLLDSQTKPATKALVLVPTRELAAQVVEETVKLSKYTDLNTCEITGGSDFKIDERKLVKNPEIIVATPGRLNKLLENDNELLSKIEILVLDEADRMLDMGFREDILSIIEKTPTNRHTMLLSATLPASIQKFSAGFLSEPTKVLISRRLENDDVEHKILLADDTQHKEQQLGWLLKEEDYNKAMVFFHTKTTVNRMDGLLRSKDIRCAYLHGDMTKKNRLNVLRLFDEGKVNVLLATDVAARGLDISGVDLVINFEMPRRGDEFVHRSGRAGRQETSGKSITIVSPPEWNLMISVQRYLKTEFTRLHIKELAGQFKGPKNQKASGKTAKKKKKKPKK